MTTPEFKSELLRIVTTRELGCTALNRGTGRHPTKAVSLHVVSYMPINGIVLRVSALQSKPKTSPTPISATDVNNTSDSHATSHSLKQIFTPEEESDLSESTSPSLERTFQAAVQKVFEVR